MAKVYVDNRNKQHERFCTAFDGEQVQVNPGARRAPIDEKFTWKMHPDITLSSGSVRTFKTAEQEAADAKEAEQAAKAVEKSAKDVKDPDKTPANGSPVGQA